MPGPDLPARPVSARRAALACVRRMGDHHRDRRRARRQEEAQPTRGHARHTPRACHAPAVLDGTLPVDLKPIRGKLPPVGRTESESMATDWQAAWARLEGAYAASTLRSYRMDCAIFAAWCASRDATPFPATPATICAFLDSEAPRVSAATLRRRLAALRKAHRLLDLPDPTAPEAVQLALRRVLRAKLARPRQAKGMTQGYLEAFLATQPDTPWGLRNRAMLALGYDLLLRRSELVALTVQDVRPREDGRLRVLIRRGKSDPYGLGRVAIASRPTAALVGAWLDWRGDGIEPLFCPIQQERPLPRALHDVAVQRLIRRAAAEAGLPPEVVRAFSGHSMRVGAAQDLVSRGRDAAAIMRAGGWKAMSVLGRYIQEAEHDIWE